MLGIINERSKWCIAPSVLPRLLDVVFGMAAERNQRAFVQACFFYFAFRLTLSVCVLAPALQCAAYRQCSRSRTVVMCTIVRTFCLRSRLSPCKRPYSCFATRCVCCLKRWIHCRFLYESHCSSKDSLSCRSPLRTFGAAGSPSGEKYEATLSKPSKSSQRTSRQVRHFMKAQAYLGEAVGRAQHKCHGSAGSTSIKKHSRPQNAAAAVCRAPW
jgi:hypothetical protein